MTDDIINIHIVKNEPLLLIGSPIRNDTIYPMNEVERCVSELNQAILEGEEIFGETIGVDELDTYEDVFEIKNPTHKFLSFTIKGNTLYGDLQIVDSQAGKELKNLLSVHRLNMFATIRALGEVTEEKEIKDLEIITFDFNFYTFIDPALQQEAMARVGLI